MVKASKDPIGDRMKDQYENRTRYYLPRRTYTIIRIDGKAFHNYTKGLKKPFDGDLMKAMNHTAFDICKAIQGAKLAYVQSDEISILLSDFDEIATSAWFDGNLQKITSISASMATAFFARYHNIPGRTALFDSRVFTIPDPNEVENYFIWRQQDATRNSINMVGQHYYSSKEMHGKKLADVQEMIYQKGDNWNNYSPGFKRGCVIRYKDINWMIDHEPPVFTQDREFLRQYIQRLQ